MMPRRRMRMMDYLMDGRNPYGSRGGYVTSRDPRDRARMRDRDMEDYEEDYRNRDMGDYRYGDRERYSSRDNTSYPMEDYARGRRDYERGGQYDSAYRPIEVMGRFNGYYGMDNENDFASGRNGRYMRDRDYRGSDYGYDYADGYKLSKRECDEWMSRLMSEVEEKDKPMLKMETIIKRAKEMGITFDKFTEEEFYLTTLMIFTDYCKTLGTSNIDLILRLSKDFLTDEDSALKYGEKLCAYLYYVVEGME